MTQINLQKKQVFILKLFEFKEILLNKTIFT